MQMVRINMGLRNAAAPKIPNPGGVGAAPHTPRSKPTINGQYNLAVMFHSPCLSGVWPERAQLWGQAPGSSGSGQTTKTS
jgi:hypothetical protein